MTLVYELDLNRIKVNHHDKYLSISKVTLLAIYHLNTHSALTKVDGPQHGQQSTKEALALQLLRKSDTDITGCVVAPAQC